MPRPTTANIFRCMWLFHHKYLAVGTLSRYKTRLAANGSTQWTDTAYLLLYVDDIVLTAPSKILNVLIKYATEILERAHIVNCNPSRTPVDTKSKLGDVVQQVCLYMHDRQEPHLSALKTNFEIGLVVLLLDDQLQTCWLRNLLRELHTPLSSATLVYCDNASAVYLSFNPVQHQLTKHIEIYIHFVRDLIAVGQVRVLHVPSRYHYADIFTKGLPSALFEEFRTNLSVQCPPAQTVGEC
ncbi:ribonuclease H-like domain-containing protein [Tanacetum coccineum]|uniref:Ribonuclease H-like domain-containing protein n=1 Tax=Tanacetum coccineum TaxID=301880 RepID=A0ABQ4Y1E8_9ASTR